jgi:hypothetical protein
MDQVYLAAGQVQDGGKFTANSEKNSEFLNHGLEIAEFCPKSENLSQGTVNNSELTVNSADIAQPSSSQALSSTSTKLNRGAGNNREFSAA